MQLGKVDLHRGLAALATHRQVGGVHRDDDIDLWDSHTESLGLPEV
jgi:hypothetical protein